jgi:hypothetical protein
MASIATVIEMELIYNTEKYKLVLDYGNLKYLRDSINENLIRYEYNATELHKVPNGLSISKKILFQIKHYKDVELSYDEAKALLTTVEYSLSLITPKN